MDTQAIAAAILARVTARGGEADLIVQQRQSLSLKASQRKLSEHAVNSSLSFGLRVVNEQRIGLASSEATDEQSLDYLVSQAFENARFSEPNGHECIIAPSAPIAVDQRALMPECNAGIEEKIAFTLELEAALLAQAKISSVPYAGYQESIGDVQLLSTQGTNVRQQSRMSAAYVYPLAADGELNAMAMGAQYGRTFAQLDLHSVVDSAYQDVIALLPGTPVKTGRYDVVFSADMQHSLMSVFLMMLSGKAAKDGINPWRNKLASNVTDARLSIIDNPHNIEGLGYSTFDSEGSATQTTTFVVNGQLETLAHNSMTAKHFNVANTSHAARGAASPLGVRIHQLLVPAGPESEQQLLADRYLEITALDGLHSGTNPISGEFSCGASGFLWENGDRVQAVRGITVAGNFYKMLNNIVAVGDQPRWDRSKESCMAAIRFADLAISGL